MINAKINLSGERVQSPLGTFHLLNRVRCVNAVRRNFKLNINSMPLTFKHQPQVPQVDNKIDQFVVTCIHLHNNYCYLLQKTFISFFLSFFQSDCCKSPTLLLCLTNNGMPTNIQKICQIFRFRRAVVAIFECYGKHFFVRLFLFLFVFFRKFLKPGLITHLFDMKVTTELNSLL